MVSSEAELSKFSDPPGDASLDDLFHPFEKNLEDHAAEASTSASSSHAKGNGFADSGKNDLATKLRATIAQKQMEKELGHGNGGDLLRLVMGVLKDDVIDMDGLVCTLIFLTQVEMFQYLCWTSLASLSCLLVRVLMISCLQKIYFTFRYSTNIRLLLQYFFLLWVATYVGP